MMTDDSWKGEHLIRAPKREKPFRVDERQKREERRAKEGKRNYERGVEDKPPKRRADYTPKVKEVFCSVPDCSRWLSATNTTGVCTMHRHHKEFCKCDTCTTSRKRRAKK